jgi:hypothetical protein
VTRTGDLGEGPGPSLQMRGIAKEQKNTPEQLGRIDSSAAIDRRHFSPRSRPDCARHSSARRA